jgi:hypothetical protein
MSSSRSVCGRRRSDAYVRRPLESTTLTRELDPATELLVAFADAPNADRAMPENCGNSGFPATRAGIGAPAARCAPWRDAPHADRETFYATTRSDAGLKGRSITQCTRGAVRSRGSKQRRRLHSSVETGSTDIRLRRVRGEGLPPRFCTDEQKMNPLRMRTRAVDMIKGGRLRCSA